MFYFNILHCVVDVYYNYDKLFGAQIMKYTSLKKWFWRLGEYEYNSFLFMRAGNSCTIICKDFTMYNVHNKTIFYPFIRCRSTEYELGGRVICNMLCNGKKFIDIYLVIDGLSERILEIKFSLNYKRILDTYVLKSLKLYKPQELEYILISQKSGDIQWYYL